MKIVKNSRWAFALAIAATLAGCSADSGLTGAELDPSDPSADVPLEINSTLQAGMEAVVSRATPPSVVLTTGDIGLFLEGTGYNARTNIKYKGTSGVWNAAYPSQTFLLNANNASVCAYYPYDGNKNTKTAVQVSTQVYNVSNQFYYATNQTVNGTRAGRAALFAMTHAYARVRLHISRKDYPTTCKITQIALINTKLPKTGTLNITNGTYTNTAGDYTSSALNQTLADESASYTHDLLMVPQTSAMNTALAVTLTVDNQAMTASIPTNQLAKFEAGKQYEIRIVIQGTGIQPTVTITDWEVTNVNNGGAYVPTPGSKPTP